MIFISQISRRNNTPGEEIRREINLMTWKANEIKERQKQSQLYLFDGPATSQALLSLNSAVQASLSTWRCPPKSGSKQSR